MDINFVREAVTVISFVIFMAIMMWAWSADSRTRFAEAEQLPFNEEAEEDVPQPAQAHGEGRA